MATEFKLPNLGEGADSGEIVGVSVKVGDSVAKGGSLCEVETNKAVMDVTANFEGKVTSVNVKPGDKVKPGQAIVSYEAGAASAAPAAVHVPEVRSAEQRAVARPGEIIEGASKPGLSPQQPSVAVVSKAPLSAPAREMSLEAPSRHLPRRSRHQARGCHRRRPWRLRCGLLRR